MAIRIEAYTLDGIMTGVVEYPGHLRDALEAEDALLVGNASLAPLHGGDPDVQDTRIAVDDVILAVGDESIPGPVHAAWHAIRLEAGPYQIEAELATMPGFDPERALARPTGTFVLLRDVRVTLLADPDAGMNTHAQAFVNRYTVDAVAADLMLGFFFPGARIDENIAAGSTTHVLPVAAHSGTGGAGDAPNRSATPPLPT